MHHFNTWLSFTFLFLVTQACCSCFCFWLCEVVFPDVFIRSEEWRVAFKSISATCLVQKRTIDGVVIFSPSLTFASLCFCCFHSSRRWRNSCACRWFSSVYVRLSFSLQWLAGCYFLFKGGCCHCPGLPFVCHLSICNCIKNRFSLLYLEVCMPKMTTTGWCCIMYGCTS